MSYLVKPTQIYAPEPEVEIKPQYTGGYLLKPTQIYAPEPEVEETSTPYNPDNFLVKPVQIYVSEPLNVDQSRSEIYIELPPQYEEPKTEINLQDRLKLAVQSITGSGNNIPTDTFVDLSTIEPIIINKTPEPIIEIEPAKPESPPPQNKPSSPPIQLDKPNWFNRPEGWNQTSSYTSEKPSILKVAWWGVTGKEGMDASNLRRYENVVIGTGMPILIISICLIVGLYVFLHSGTKWTPASDHRNDDWFNQMINWLVEKYDTYVKRR
jgi:hypothetical protein